MFKNGEKFLSRAQAILLALVSFAWLSFCFVNDPFGLGRSTDIRNSSEELIVVTLERSETVLGRFPPGPIFWPRHGVVERYYSQFGGQGIVIAKLANMIAPKASPAAVISVANVVIGLLLAMTLTAFTLLIAGEYGLVAGLVLALLLGWSTWIVAFAVNAYWVAFTFFLPMVTVWAAYALLPPQRALLWGSAAAVVTIAIKSLCGYEYISNVAGAVWIPVLYFGLQKNLPRRQLVKHLATLAFAAVAGFLIALALQIGQLAANAGSEGFSNFRERVMVRTASDGEGLSDTYDAALVDGLRKLRVPSSVLQHAAPIIPHLRPALRYFRYQAKPAVALFGMQNASIPIGVFSLGTLLLGAFLLFRKGRVRLSDVRAPLATLLLAFAISNSWVVLGHGHMTHLHLNAIIFYVPFILMAYVLIAAFIGKQQQQMARRSGSG